MSSNKDHPVPPPENPEAPPPYTATGTHGTPPVMEGQPAPSAKPGADAQPVPNPEPGLAEQLSEQLTEQLAELKAKHAEVADAFLRAKAEADNIRRRAEEDMAKARKFAIEAFAESLLPVRDSLEAALALQGATNEQLTEGVQVTLRQLAAALERNKVVQVAPPAGTKFDPHQHQAISMVPSQQEANTVVAVLQKGYLINERVLRPALVTVAAPK